MQINRIALNLKQQIALLEKADTGTPPILIWNHSKTDIAELIMELHSLNSFNNPHHYLADINEIVQIFSLYFGVEFPNIQKTFIEIKNRQNPTKFLEKLREALLNQIDEELGN